MHRALRLLASLALLGFGLSLVGIGLLLAGVARPGSVGPPGSSSAINMYVEVRQRMMYIGLLVSVAARLTLATSFAAVVVAVVACLQRRQRGWASLLLGEFLLIPLSLYLYLRYVSLWGIFMFLGPLSLSEGPIGIDALFIQQLVGVLVALLVLGYSVSSPARLPPQGQRRPEPDPGPAPAAGATLPEHAHMGPIGAALPLNGVARALALAGLLGLGVFLIAEERVSSGPLPVGMAGGIVDALLLLAHLLSQFAFAAAVVAVVACLQRRQRVWAGVVTGVLVLLTGWVALNLWALAFLPGVLAPFEAHYLPYYFAGEISFMPSRDLLWVGQVVQVVVPALLALVSSLIPAPAVSPALRPALPAHPAPPLPNGEGGPPGPHHDTGTAGG